MGNGIWTLTFWCFWRLITLRASGGGQVLNLKLFGEKQKEQKGKTKKMRNENAVEPKYLYKYYPLVWTLGVIYSIWTQQKADGPKAVRNLMHFV